MTLLLENDFAEILRHDNVKAFELRYKPTSVNLFGERFIEQMTILKDQIIEQAALGHTFQNLIINTINGGPTIEPEVQEWMHSTFYPLLIENNITTKAYCMGEEIISKLSIELTADDKSNSSFKYDYFSSLEDALKWIKNQNIEA